MSRELEKPSGGTITVTSHCAMAFARAIDDLENHFSSYPDDDVHSTFKEFFKESYDTAICSDRGDKIAIFFHLQEGMVLGGGVSYLIDKNNYTIIERIFGS